MLSIAQIYAIVALLLAFGVDQPTVTNVQGILEGNSSAPSQVIAPVQVAPNTGGVGVVQSNPMTPLESEPTLQPAYTEDQLRQVFLDRLPQWAKTGAQSTTAGVWPVGITTSSTTATIGYDGYYINWADVTIDGDTILHMESPESNPLNNTTTKTLKNLTPNTQYSYQLIWKESGRQDTVITKTFKTLPQ